VGREKRKEIREKRIIKKRKSWVHKKKKRQKKIRVKKGTKGGKKIISNYQGEEGEAKVHTITEKKGQLSFERGEKAKFS